MPTQIEVGKVFANKRGGGRVRVCDILPAVGVKYNFIYYIETNVREYTPSYRMSLPEHSFIKRYRAAE